VRRPLTGGGGGRRGGGGEDEEEDALLLLYIEVTQDHREIRDLHTPCKYTRALAFENLWGAVGA